MLTVNVPTGVAPLYHQYPGQINVQDAYVTLDCETESLSADWNGEIGNAIPFDVYYGYVRRYPISPYIKGSVLYDLLNSKEVIELAQIICDGYESSWDGRNNIAMLNEDAEEAEQMLESYLDKYLYLDEDDGVIIGDEDWFWQWRHDEIEAATSDKELIQNVEEAESFDKDTIITIDLEEFFNELRYRLREEELEDEADSSLDWQFITKEGENPVYQAEEDGIKYQMFFDKNGVIQTIQELNNII